MTPTEYLIKQLEDPYVDELECVVVLRRHKDGCISFSSSSGRRGDIFTLCEMTKLYVQTDIVREDIQEIL